MEACGSLEDTSEVDDFYQPRKAETRAQIGLKCPAQSFIVPVFIAFCARWRPIHYSWARNFVGGHSCISRMRTARGHPKGGRPKWDY